jgi:hypothetical protein
MRMHVHVPDMGLAESIQASLMPSTCRVYAADGSTVYEGRCRVGGPQVVVVTDDEEGGDADRIVTRQITVPIHREDGSSNGSENIGVGHRVATNGLDLYVSTTNHGADFRTATRFAAVEQVGSQGRFTPIVVHRKVGGSWETLDEQMFEVYLTPGAADTTGTEATAESSMATGRLVGAADADVKVDDRFQRPGKTRWSFVTGVRRDGNRTSVEFRESRGAT